jgi:hypothetical protein
MKKLLLAAPIVLLSACAATNGGDAPTRTASADGSALYCWERKVMSEGGGMLCNWAANPKDACRSNDFTVVRNIATGPVKSRRCENGEWLVMVTTR